MTPRPPADHPLRDESSDDRLPFDESPSDRLPFDESPSDQLPSDQLSVDQLPFDQLPFDDPTADIGSSAVDAVGAADTAPPDADVRRRIRNELGTTLFVEAGAGAGKTTSLVERIVSLVASGVPIVGIAAITFTEKAAAELRARVRQELALAVRDEKAAPTMRARYSEALDRLDHAPIGTLHAFARRILFDFPIEAGVPPGFTVLDELESNLAFDERWDDLLDDLLGEAAPEGGVIAGGREFVELCEFDRLGIERGVRGIAEDFAANWDLVEERVDLADPGPIIVDTRAIIAAVEEMEAATVPPDDPQARHLEGISRVAHELDHAEGLRRQLEVLDDLKKAARPARGGGRKTEWKAYGGADALDAQRARAEAVCAGVDAAIEAVKMHRRLVLGAVLGKFVLDGATERMRLGRLEFHDLLVLARRLLATRPDIRAILHGRYERVLLDEFQDTDPIQLEIAVRLTAAVDDPTQRGNWRALRPAPGRLFIVGDPKQSIYRFRRADISQYLRAADQLGAASVGLSANFRSTRAVIEFTNAVFDELISFEADAQPAFQPLDACRRASLLEHGSVTVLGAERHDDLDRSWRSENDDGIADTLRSRESLDVAAAIATAIAEGWQVVDDGALRACRPGDICILLPSRLALAPLESALRDAQIPYRAENSSVVYATSEIRNLLLALRAADDPTDHLALVAVLRTALYGCSDIELYEWKTGGGSWNLWAPPPSGFDGHPVALAIAHVRSIAERIGWITPADLLAAVADERRVLDLALDRPDARDVWRRVRFVIEQARAWADAGGHGVRRYLTWTRLQAAEGRISETILPEHDADAVRIMTIHAAKGLEFPITVVAGLTTKRKGGSGTRVVFAENDWMLTGRGDDGRFDAYAPVDEQMGDAERRRLLYVACTRAVDHLVVSTHRAMPAKNNADYSNRSTLTSAELLFAAGATEAAGASMREFRVEPMATRPLAPLQLDHSDPVAWAAERDRALTTGARRTGIAATRLADELSAVADVARIDDPGLDKYPVNVDLAPWRRGRYGTSIGRAVHGVLQFCDLDDGHDINTLARAQCAAEGIIGLDDRVAALAHSALAAPMVRAVVGGADHWRELFVVAPIADRVLEGYVDLLVRTHDGLVIVDYKTDQWSGAAQAGERIARYRIQLAAYGIALEGVLGEPVIGGVLIRCRPDADAEEIAIDDWQGALDDVRELMA